MTTLLPTKMQEGERLRQVAQVYETANRILVGDARLVMEIDNLGAQAPAAYSTGTKIVFNADAIKDIDIETIERLHGLDMHELCHVLYTPRANTKLGQWVMDNGMMQPYNFLEDQRIESFFTASYSATIPWLTATVSRWVLESPQAAADTGFLLCHGRKYLPRVLRDALAKSFIFQDLKDEAAAIIDEYRLLTFPTDYDRAEELILAFDDILNRVRTHGGRPDFNPNEHGKRPVEMPTGGRPVGVKEQREAADKAKDQDNIGVQIDNDTDQEASKSEDTEAMGEGGKPQEGQPQGTNEYGHQGDDDDSDSGEGGQGQGAQGQDGETGEPEGSGGESGESESEGESEGDGSGESGSADNVGDQHGGREAGTGGGTPMTDPVEAAQQILDEIRNHKEYMDEVKNVRRQILDVLTKENIPAAQFGKNPIRPDVLAAQRKFERQLRRMREQAEPGWNKRENHGRLNVMRYMQERNLDEAFDLFDEGVDDATDIEAVLLVDTSGSMGGIINQALETMWIVKRTLDRLEASTTVLTFSSDCYTLYPRGSKAEGNVLRYFYDYGGTVPTYAIAQAAVTFAQSKRKTKLFIVITDGEWGSWSIEGRSNEDWIEAMNANGITTALAFLYDTEGWWGARNQPSSIDSHGCKVTVELQKANGLTEFAESLVKQSVKDRIARGRRY